MTTPADRLRELRFALAEADAEEPSGHLRARIVDAAVAARRPGRPTRAPTHIPGVEVFRRTVNRLDGLLSSLAPDEWSKPALRGLDVQATVGHLIGVERAFARAVAGRHAPGDDKAAGHVASTQPIALAQAGRPTVDTHLEWGSAVTQSLAAVEGVDGPVNWYGITLPLDQLLVVRGFEIWTHDEDIRRATRRPLPAPDNASLARMADLAITLLPVGIAGAGRARPDCTARLVLTGPSGGTWDIPLGGPGSRPSRPADTRIVVDTAEFCRIVAARHDPHEAAAAVSGDIVLATDVFAGAAALALD